MTSTGRLCEFRAPPHNFALVFHGLLIPAKLYNLWSGIPENSAFLAKFSRSFLLLCFLSLLLFKFFGCGVSRAALFVSSQCYPEESRHARTTILPQKSAKNTKIRIRVYDLCVLCVPLRLIHYRFGCGLAALCICAFALKSIFTRKPRPRFSPPPAPHGYSPRYVPSRFTNDDKHGTLDIPNLYVGKYQSAVLIFEKR